MHWLLTISLLTAHFITGVQAAAQPFNPYSERYNSWNREFPGYSNGSGAYRRQVRDLNPYRDQYRSFGKERRETLRWLGID